MSAYHLYCLTFPNGKRYIGYTANPKTRWRSHGHGRQLVHEAIRQYGMPKTIVLCVGSRSYIAALEGPAILAFQTHLPAIGYNVLIGRNHTLATRSVLSASRMGIKPWNKGVPRTPEERANIKAALAASEAFVAVRQRIGGWNKGIPNSAETRAKIGAYHKGKPKSLEQRTKMSAARKKAWAEGKYN